MRGTLDPHTASKLAKICGRLGSEYDGERANAALLATRTLSAVGMTWGDVFTTPAPPQHHSVRPGSVPPHAFHASWALAFPHLLTEWETGFLRDLIRRRKATAKQAAKLAQIMDSLRARGAA